MTARMSGIVFLNYIKYKNTIKLKLYNIYPYVHLEVPYYMYIPLA